MFRIFRINDPYRLIFVLIILIILRIALGIYGIPLSHPELKSLLIGQRLGEGFLMYKEAYDFTGPLSSWVYKMSDLLFGRSRIALQILSTCWLFVNAALFNLMLNRNKAFTESNYLPAFLIVLGGTAIPDFLSLSPQLMSSTFVILAMNNVFRRIDNEVTDELFLYSGIYLGLGTLFYLPAGVYFIFFLLAFLLFSNPVPRRVMLYFYGFILPLVCTYGYYYWFDAHTYFIESYLIRGISGSALQLISWENMYGVLAVPGIWMLIGLFNTFFAGRYTNYQSKINQVLLIIAIAGIVAIWLDVMFMPSQLLLFLFPFSFFLTQYVLLLRKKYYKLVVPFLIIGTLILTPYWAYSRLNQTGIISEKRQLPYEGKRIFVLSDNLNYYTDQIISGPSIDPELSQLYLGSTNTYQMATAVFRSINEDLPDVIIDDWRLIPDLFYRFPLLEKNYRVGANNRYFRIASN